MIPRRHLEGTTAAEKYKDLEFVDPHAFFNKPAPGPRISFVIGGVLGLIAFLIWLVRVELFKQKLRERKIKLRRSLVLRLYITCAMDLEDPFYSIVRYAAHSFFFLGGIQLEFFWTLLAIFIAYTIWATAEVSRVLIAYYWTPSLKTLVVEDDLIASQLRGIKTQLTPTNVYEDIGRGFVIVIMVFLTQGFLISVVCLDIYSNDVNNCLDGTKNCPVAGTLGSWGFYVVGIFMACVFQLGPKTKYGESEQNPAYWLHLLLTAKEKGARVSWYDPVKDQVFEQALSTGDGRIWLRFFMSFLVNGIGYHILVHALPVQVAQQTSLTGFALRAVGMMYLVDMDDSTGYKLTVVLPPSPAQMVDGSQKKNELNSNGSPATPPPPPPPPVPAPIPPKTHMHGASSYEIYKSTQEIIEDAKRRLDALNDSHSSYDHPSPHQHEEVAINVHTSVRESLLGSFVVHPTKEQLKEAFYGGKLKTAPTATSMADADLELGTSLPGNK